MKDIKEKFLYELTIARKRGDITEIEPKALYDEIAEQWLVGVYYMQGGRRESFILAERKTEEEAKKIEEFINKNL